MSKRLSKISRELKIGITAIADFLNKNGYQCEEDPNETISDEVVEFVYSNIKSYISEPYSGDVVEKSEQIKSDKTDKVPIPLELKIVDAVSKQKKLIERIIGFSDFDWHYIITKFKGICSQPVDFNLFDEAICTILLKGETSAKSIGKILGFDIETDPAEREILLSAIHDLIKDKMIDGDESVYWLTDTGRKYANNGVKFSTFERDFELYIDATGSLRESAKEVFSKLKSEKQNTFQQENLPQNIEDVKLLAEVQAPEIHFPAKEFILQSCQPIGAEGYIAKVWVVLLENFRDNTIRSLVYDEKQDAIIESLSESFDSLEEERNKLLDKLLSESEEDDFTVESTVEQKQECQILSEKELIEKQKEIDTAIANNDVAKIASIHNEIVEVKRHFNSLEFEVELKRLFDETSDELWIISPWIKKYATFRRILFFENYLRKGGRIFIAYSLPENNTDTMADAEALEKLYELEQKYHNFYIHQLPAFHYKRVWLRTKEGKDLYYTGSYNILSFFVKQGLQNYRQEEMSRLDWNSENDEEYEKIFLKFGEKYLNDTFDSLNELCQSKAPIDKDFLQKIKGANYGKIKVFLNKGYGVFDDKFAEIEQIKKIYYTEQLKKIKADLTDVKDKTIPFEKRKSFQSQLNILTKEYPDISRTEEFLSVVEVLTSIVIPDGVTSIGRSAFKDCSGLTSIVIPDSVTSIGEKAFKGCSGLTSIVIPDSVTSIGKSAFWGCSGLTSIVIPDGVTSIEEYAFYYCSGLTSIVIPDSVTSIGEKAFMECSGLTSIVIPDSVTSIGEYAFWKCSGLTSIVIPDSVTSIGKKAFMECSGLTSIVIPDGVTSIGEDAFWGCSGLTSIVIPDSVTSIGERAFKGCSGLTSIVIPDSVTSIGKSAFSNCSGLKEIRIPKGTRDKFCAMPELKEYENLLVEYKKEEKEKCAE